jgi:hypothetical protein
VHCMPHIPLTLVCLCALYATHPSDSCVSVCIVCHTHVFLLFTVVCRLTIVCHTFPCYSLSSVVSPLYATRFLAIHCRLSSHHCMPHVFLLFTVVCRLTIVCHTFSCYSLSSVVSPLYATHFLAIHFRLDEFRLTHLKTLVTPFIKLVVQS